MTLPDELKAKERALFREIEEGKKNVADLLSRLNNAMSQADLISRCGTLETNVAALQSGKADVNHTHAWSAITGKPTLFSGNYNDLSNKPNKVFPFKAVVSGGNAVFYLTVDGTASGAAFFASGVNLDSMQLTAEEADAPHTFGTPVLSNGNKTLTVPVKKSGGINVALVGLTLLGAPVAANGSTVRLLIAGAS